LSDNRPQATGTPETSPQTPSTGNGDCAPDLRGETEPQAANQPPLEMKRGLAEQIQATCGEDVHRCYQCLKCSAGCPMTFAMDFPPSQIMRLVQLGQEEMLLGSKTIWVCVTCNTCSIRCPNDIDIALVIDSLRERALKKGVKPAVEKAALFHKYFLDNMKKRGRTFEGELLARYQLKTGQAVQNAGLGMRMFFKGRLSMLPESVENKKAFREMIRRVEERGETK
jgi:heterodisulfide reductase subunit C